MVRSTLSGIGGWQFVDASGESVSGYGGSLSPSWRRVLLLPSAARLGAQAPRDRRVGWDRFWGEVETTGDGGDVLWDTSDSGEIAQYLPIVLQYLDPTLPVVDVGCGNGRQSRILAEHFPSVLGVDLSSVAVELARRETGATGGRVRFEPMDLTTAGAGLRLADEVGAANVFVRGVFHVLSASARLQMVANLEVILGGRGRLFLAETNYSGGVLGYLRHLGARPGRIPVPLQRAIQRLPKPRHFGAAERAACLPADAWKLEVDGVTEIYTIPLEHGRHSLIPGYYAVLTPRRGGTAGTD